MRLHKHKYRLVLKAVHTHASTYSVFLIEQWCRYTKYRQAPRSSILLLKIKFCFIRTN